MLVPVVIVGIFNASLITVYSQTVVMAMILGSSGISTVLFLYWQKNRKREAL